MQKKKVIGFLIKYKFTESDFANLNFSNLSKIFNAKFIDISKITLSKKIQILISKIKKKKLFYNKVNNLSDLKKKLSDIDFIFDYQNSLIEDKIVNNFFNKIAFKKSKILGILAGRIPAFFDHSYAQKIYFLFILLFSALKYKKFSHAINYLKKKFIIHFQSLYKKNKSCYFSYDYILVDSDLSEKKADRYFNNSKKIYGHYKDYEKHLSRADIKQYKNNYIVFLDEAIFNHPDNYQIEPEYLLPLKKNINTYFKDLNIFFDNLESYTNNKIVIAAHPRGFLNFDYENYFKGRRIIRNNTYELIKNSKLVLAHSSTAVAYAVILKKPIIFLSSSLMFDIGYFPKILSFSIETGGKIIEINNKNNINFNDLFIRDFSLYKNYLNKFVKSSKSKNKNLWDIVGSIVVN